MEEKEIEKMQRNLGEKDVCLKSDFPLRTIKKNIDIFTKFLTSSFNEAITFSQFPSIM